MSSDATDRAGILPRLFGRLFGPVDIASVVFFRIAFGAILIWEVWRYFAEDWIDGIFIKPIFHFHYAGFEWVKPLPGNGMYWVFGAMGACAGLIMIGLLYRAATAAFFVLFTYMFLIDQARYLNHFYLIVLISFILIFVPAHRAISVDAWIRPKIRSSTVPRWAVWWIRFQVGVVYFFGGVHKLNPDWLRGEPMRTWLLARLDNYPLIGHWFDRAWMVDLFTYGGIAFDLLIVPALLFKWTRWPAFIAALGFHVFNSEFFKIGIFPWFMIAATLMFFPPDWPRRVWRFVRFRRKKSIVPLKTPSDGELLDRDATVSQQNGSEGVFDRQISQPVLDLVDVRVAHLYRIVPVEEKGDVLVIATADPTNLNNLKNIERLLERPVETIQTTAEDMSLALAKFYGIEDESLGIKPPATRAEGLRFAQMAPLRKAFVVFLACYVVVQVTLPLRPYMYPGNILWSERGLWFSWNMMLSVKEADVVFELHDPRTGKIWRKYPESYLTNFQWKVAVRRPEMVLELAHHIAEEVRREGYPDVEVYAKSLARINGRTPQVYLNPDLNLANVKPGFDPHRWLIPLKEKYPPKEAWQYEEITEDQIAF